MKSRKLAILSVALALTSVACTHQVRPNPSPLRAEAPPLHLKARYFISERQKNYVHEDHFFALGAAHTWNIEVGSALAQTFPQMLTTVFDSVQEAKSPEDLGDANMLLIPTVKSFSVDGGSFISSLVIEVRAADGTSTQLMDEDFASTTTEGSAGEAWLGGAFAGESALQQSAEKAINDVIPKIAGKLRKTFAARAEASAAGTM